MHLKSYIAWVLACAFILSGTPQASTARSTTSIQGSPLSPGELRLDLSADGQNARLSGGQYLSLRLPVNLSTGYNWQVVGHDPNLIEPFGEMLVEPESELLGAEAKITLRFASRQAGTSSLRLVYQRPFEKESTPLRTFQVNVTASEPSSPQIIAQAAAEKNVENPPPPVAPVPESVDLLALPTSYNVCALGGCTPIKDQQTCGSCWAFGTVGVFESKLLMVSGLTRDLSEQFLVSCNNYNYSCNGGWWYAHDYHTDTLGKNQSVVGSVYETDKPYQNSNGTCTTVLPHQEKLYDWNWITSGGNLPSVDAIKQAIYTNGAVGASVCVGPAFQAYRSGIFQTNESSICGGNGSNHGIVLVGWNDTEGVWYLRNSWGTYWGESITTGGQKGYMRIKYGTSNVGLSANYVSMNLLETPILLSAVPLSNTQIQLTWSDKSTSETGFEVERAIARSNTWNKIAQTAANATSYTDSTAVCHTVYDYRVRAFNSTLWSMPSTVIPAGTCLTQRSFFPGLFR